jgi:hypothetical protein
VTAERSGARRVTTGFPQPVVPRRGVVWNRETPKGLRAYGFDFGPFALVVLLDAKADCG